MDILNIDVDANDTVSALKQKTILGLHAYGIMDAHEMTVQACWKSDQTAPPCTTMTSFSENGGEIIVRGASRSSATKLSDAEGMITMREMMRLYKHKSNKIALRAIVDAARDKVKTLVKKCSWFEKAKAKTWRESHRVYGQGEDAWKLWVFYLDESHPTWKADICIDEDVFATINHEEYGKVLNAAAHEVSDHEKEEAVHAVKDELKGMYESVLQFIR